MSFNLVSLIGHYFVEKIFVVMLKEFINVQCYEIKAYVCASCKLHYLHTIVYMNIFDAYILQCLQSV